MADTINQQTNERVLRRRQRSRRPRLDCWLQWDAIKERIRIALVASLGNWTMAGASHVANEPGCIHQSHWTAVKTDAPCQPNAYCRPQQTIADSFIQIITRQLYAINGDWALVWRRVTWRHLLNGAQLRSIRDLGSEINQCQRDWLTVEWKQSRVIAAFRQRAVCMRKENW